MGGCRKLLETWSTGTKKCMTISFGGFNTIPEYEGKASFTEGFNSTFVYDLLPVSGTSAPMLSAWVDQEFDTTNTEGVDWVTPEGVVEQEQVEVHIYRSAWTAVDFFLRPSPEWYRGGMCALVTFSIGGKKFFLTFHEFNRNKSGIPTLRDKKGRTIMITRTEEKPWVAEVAENQEVS
jgi:hypothetical protein